jgi:transcriptional regulator with XRE-family HTH domain
MSEDVVPYGGLKPNETERTEELRALIDALGFSQRQAADELEVDPRTLRYWAAANPAPPRMAIFALRYLADAKGVKVMNALGRMAAGSMRGTTNALARAPTLNALARAGQDKERDGVVYKEWVRDEDSEA